jgi:hypothetical protein
MKGKMNMKTPQITETTPVADVLEAYFADLLYKLDHNIATDQDVQQAYCLGLDLRAAIADFPHYADALR